LELEDYAAGFGDCQPERWRGEPVAYKRIRPERRYVASQRVEVAIVLAVGLSLKEIEDEIACLRKKRDGEGIVLEEVRRLRALGLELVRRRLE